MDNVHTHHHTESNNTVSFRKWFTPVVVLLAVIGLFLYIVDACSKGSAPAEQTEMKTGATDMNTPHEKAAEKVIPADSNTKKADTTAAPAPTTKE